MEKLKVFAFFLSLILIGLSCKNEEDPTTPPSNYLGEIDPAYVGTWIGEIDGTLGIEATTFFIRDEGNIATTGPANSAYCPYNGLWGVDNNKFRSEGTDNCNGSMITMTATLSGNMLSGSWVSSSGNSGTFAVEKQ